MTFIDRYGGCTGQIADVTCCFLLRNFYTIFMEKVSFYHALMRKNCKQSFAFNEKGPFNGKITHDFPLPIVPRALSVFPLFRFFYWESFSSEPACVHTPPFISQIFLICAKFFHTRLSTVNHRRPFSDFY